MPTTNSITTTYAGEAASKFISAALLSSPTIDRGLVEVRPNVKFKQVIRKFDTDGLVKDASCDFTDTSTLTTVERILQPKELQVNLELCKADYRDTWDAIKMGYSAHDVLPPNFQSYLVGHVAAKVAAENELSIWQGATGTSGQFDGFETLLAANASQPAGQEVLGTTLTKANIITELEKVEDAIPNAVWSKEDGVYYVSVKTARLYAQAQAALGYLDKFHVGATEFDFHGKRMVACPGMSDDVVVYARKSDLYFGTGLLSDLNQVKVIDMADIDGSQNVRVVMRYTAGVQFGNGEDIVTYGITNASN